MEDKNHIYEVGDAFPREGMEVSEERIKILVSKKNKIGEPLIKKIATKRK